MKKLLVLLLLLVSTSAMAATYPVTATFTHNFKDTAGGNEIGTLTVKLYNNATNALVSTATITGPVTNQSLPGFNLTVPDNTATSVQFYATATDAAGNVSAKGMSNIVVVPGLDTLAPGTISVTITITP